MEKKEILQAFKQAEIDWSKPIEEIFENNTYSGLCWYFEKEQCINPSLVHYFLKPLWKKFITKNHGLYHFYNNQERLEAIRKVINELENE